MPRKPALSKSAFIRGNQCLKSLYLLKNFPELRDPISESQQAIFNRGHSVGALAQQLFPGGTLAAFELPRGFMKSIKNTKDLVSHGTSILYEAGFMFQNTHCFVDILVKENEKWHIYEVKSSTSISETYTLDAAFQYYVLNSLGLEIGDISIIYMNNQYIRQGQLDIQQLFSMESVHVRVLELQEKVRSMLEEQATTLFETDVPEIPIGQHCNDPYGCDFMGHCWQDVPDYSVFDITRLKADKKFELFNQGILLPKDVPPDYPLSENQRIQVQTDKSGKSQIDKQGLRSFIHTLEYPLYFLDFETFNPAVPLYDESRPYQQIVFQYSLHILDTPGGELKHREFLAGAPGDPRLEMIKQLLDEMGEAGSIVVYNKGFEIGRLNEIGRDFPQFNAAIQKINDRIIDLMTPFQQKLFYTPKMKGSYSIKQVLPALVPEFSYADLEINNGGDASLAFESLLKESSSWVIQKTRKNLLAYCELDTLAMVEILNILELKTK